MKNALKIGLICIIAICFMQCKINQSNNASIDKQSIQQEVLGFNFLNRIPGLWHGPVYSSTSAGSFDEWYVDFRPVSASQISQFSMLDSKTVNITSFFVVKHNDQLKIAMRTEGCFADKCCVTYEVMDSVDESTGYYRFVDFVAGKKRAYTEFRFSDNQFVMEVYTSKFNNVNPVQLHSRFEAKRFDWGSASEAIAHFSYPQANMVKDFSNAFDEQTESIFFDMNKDPYKSIEQPYVGKITINISISPTLPIKQSDEICLLFTTEPLYEGLQYLPERMGFLSKYVFLPAETKSITIQNVHPGKYYCYSFLDLNNDKKHLSGDYMSSALDNIINVQSNEVAIAETLIDLIIP